MGVAQVLAGLNQREQRDFLGRMEEAERRKAALRRPYAASATIERQRIWQRGGILRPGQYDQWRVNSSAFWREVQSVNDVLVPEDPVYSGSIAGVSISTSKDFWTLGSATTGQTRVLESFLGGEATASAVVRISLQRSTAGVTSTNQTPELFSTRSPAAAGLFATNWTTAPTLSGNPTLQISFNAFGGGDRWVAQPGEEIYLLNGEKLSCRSASGTPILSGSVVFEEL